MPETLPLDPATALAQLDAGLRKKKWSADAVQNIRKWLTEPRYAPYAAQVAEHLAEEKWQELDDAFRTVIPFGAGGRRRRMYPIGCNAINDRTIGESAQGLAEFVLGLEESHGYLAGQHARDKDGALAAMLVAEAAAEAKAAGKSVCEKLDDLFWQHGYHAEHLLNLKMEGSEGLEQMKALMQRFRDQPPRTLAGVPVVAVRDYQNLTTRAPDGAIEPLVGPQGDLVILDLGAEGNYIAVRPSGTEPKVKFYMFTYVPAEQLADLEQTKQDMDQRLKDFRADLRAFVDAGQPSKAAK